MSKDDGRSPPDEYDHDWDNDECWNCGGEGFVYSCVSEYACIDPEGGCNLCMRRCDVCRPSKPNPELRQVLADALSATDAPDPSSMENSRDD